MAALGHATYLILDLLSLAGPLAYGFTRHSGFNRKWRSFLPALLLVAVPFIAWDILFTARGIWGFNSDFHLGISILNLPIEEWLFFFCIPYACLFLHDVAGHFSQWHPRESWARKFWGLVGLVCFLIAASHGHQAYTVTAFGLAGCMSLVLALGGMQKIARHFTLTFAFSCIPFFVVNGFLTSLPVVIYNDTQNLGVRMGTIPVEDLAFSLGLIASNVFLFELWIRHSKTRMAKS